MSDIRSLADDVEPYFPLRWEIFKVFAIDTANKRMTIGNENTAGNYGTNLPGFAPTQTQYTGVPYLAHVTGVAVGDYVHVLVHQVTGMLILGKAL